MKFYIIRGNKYLMKNFNFGVSKCTSGHLISQNVKFTLIVIAQSN